jgi:glycosyltransferase involved in cell wall biosynthesis
MPHIAVIGRHRPYSGGYLAEEPFISDGLRKAGMHVSEIDIHTLSDADAIHHLRRYSVDVALFTHATIGRSIDFWRQVAELGTLRHRVLWTPDVILYGGRPEQYAARAPYLDLILHPEDEDLSEYGMPNAAYFCAAATPSEDSAAAINWNAKKHALTCAFFGNIYDDQRKEIVDRLTRNFGRRFKVFSMADRTGVYGAELARICSTTKVVVGINARNNLQGYWSDRMYQIPAHGGFLLAPKVPGIESHLTPGEHFATYDDIESIPKHVMHWAKNTQERERIRQAGFQHVRKWHTWDQRAIELLSTLSSHQMITSASAPQMFRVVVPVYNAKEWVTKCLRSIREQTIKDFTCVVIDDASTDGTADIARRFCSADPRFTFIGNESNIGALANIIRGIDVQRPEDHDVIVTVDGDDWLAHTKVFARLAQAYRDPNMQLTYGQFMQIAQQQPGWCRKYPEEIVKNRAYRQHDWIASHLRTFRYKLWRQINRKHLNDPETGEPWEMAWDVAMMVPMLEMCDSGQFQFIPDILYSYNNLNPLNDHKVDAEKQRDMHRRILALPSYAPSKQGMSYGYNPERNEPRWRALKEQLEEIQPASVVDYGSNYGYFSVAAAQAYPQAFVASIESGGMGHTDDVRYGKAGMLKHHREDIQRMGLNNNVIWQFAVDPGWFKYLNDGGARFDVQLCMSFLHWLDLPTRADFVACLRTMVQTANTTMLEMPKPELRQHNGSQIMQWYDGERNPIQLIKTVLSGLDAKITHFAPEIRYRPLIRIDLPKRSPTSRARLEALFEALHVH